MHPVRIVVELLAREQPVAGPYPPELAHSLREWGCAGERAPVAEAPPSLAIDDDPCPRRRHARTVLQRMLRMGKVGPGYHTEFDHFRRGAAAHERRLALDARGGPAARGPARREAERRPAPHLPQREGAARHPRAHRPRRDARPGAAQDLDRAGPRRGAQGWSAGAVTVTGGAVTVAGGAVTVSTGTERSSVTRPAGGESPRAA